MNKAEKIIKMILISHNQTAKVLQPSEQTFNFPAIPIASQGTTILRVFLFTILFMRCNELDPLLSKFCIKRIAVVSSISNYMFGSSSKKPFFDSMVNKGDFMRRSRCSVDGERKTSAVCHCHELRTFAALGISHSEAPFFAITKVASIKHWLKSK